MVNCSECDKSFDSESMLKTHNLLHHPELASSDSSSYEQKVSKGHLNEREIEKGEQFGYQK